jgi:hypothetical protein
MTKSCVVSFAPGSGGHFIGSVCQYILHGIEIIIQPTGSCHGSVKSWGHPELLLQHSGEAISHEMVLIKKLHVDPTQIIVTHSRNLFSLKEKFDKVVYINFSESDLDAMSNKYKSKNLYQEIPEPNYNSIKDPSWPSYQDFLQGLAPDFVYNEINQLVTKTVYQEWVWIIPVLQKFNNIYKIEFSDIFNNDTPQWIFNLIDFLGVAIESEQLAHIKESWQKYKRVQ